MPTGDRNIKVLLVDDEPDFLVPLAKRLNKRGLLVQQAGGGPEALALMKNHPPDVVVLDIKMPDMDGLSVLDRIKVEYPAVEVLLLTGQATAQDGVAGMKAGAFDYLSKPIQVEHLVGKIRQAFDKIIRQEEQAREIEFRKKMEQRMIAAERLASLGTLATGVAHEINNPLAIIAESAGWLKTRLAKEEHLPASLLEASELALAKIETSVERAKRITHQLLGFARKTGSVVQEFDLGVIINEVIELTQKQASEVNAEVVTRMETEQLRIWSDPYQLRQVLINLVSNALQAITVGGRVEVIVSGDQNKATLTVQDNGSGIPKENMERIFEPFYSTKPPGQGTGLGLSVSRGIVEKLGGRVEVESQIGMGSAFRVILPWKPSVP